MSNKINVKEFVDGYMKCATAKTKESYLKKIQIKEYVDYEVKMALATKVVNASSYNSDKQNVVKVNAPMRYILFVYTVLSYYTNLDMDSTKMFEQFNLLNKNKLIDEIIKLIPEHEISEFNKIVSMTYEDFLTNYYEPHGFIADQIGKIGTLFEYLPDGVLDKIAETAGKFLEFQVGDE